MKKKNLLILLFCFMAGVVYSNPIGLSQALKIASKYMQAPPSVENLAPIRRAGRVAASVGDTLAPYYVISRGDNAGFVIVSGDDCLPEIIGYTDSGDFVEEQMPPALLDMLEGYSELVQQAQIADAPARAPRKVVAGRVSIEPIVKAHWHQSAPYNDLAPFITNTTNRALTGCTCTAAVMILHHFRRDLPDELQAATPTYGYGDAPVTVSYPKGTPILWDLMQYDYNGNYPEEMRNAVALLNATFGAGIWQTYGNSTSGQISNVVDGYNQYFNLGSTCLYKSSTSQSNWESLVYGNLVNGQPMVYAGVHATNGGHAIILDGYNASNGLFHFNFGWGGQGDGYYTLDDETGVNGFAGQQGMVYNIAPKRPNISAELHVEPQAYKRMESTIRVTATNYGTLDYSGFNLYWSTSSREPSGSTKVSATNTTLTLATGESGEFATTFKPSSERTYYIFLTDKNYNVLDKKEIDVQTAQPSLSLQSFDITASSDTEVIDDESYRLLYNNEMEAVAMIANAADATPLQTNIRMELIQYSEANDAMEFKENISFDTHDFIPGETSGLSTVITGLEVGERYALSIRSILRNVENGETMCTEGVDTIIRFKVCDATLDSISVEGTAMTLTGGWDALRFRSLASDTAITSYDLTRVSGIGSQPIAGNPNALFYTGEAVSGYNIVCQGCCDELRLQPGANFVPQGTFTAKQAMFTPQWSIDDGWQPFALPFTAEKPRGYICRRVTGFSSTAITQVEYTDTLCAYTPYMIMACDDHPIIAENVTISTEPVASESSMPSFQPVVSRATADDNTLVYDSNPESNVQYFVRVDVGTLLTPFTAVVKSDARRVRSYTSTSLDKSYKELGRAIGVANHTYDLLHQQIEAEWNAILQDSISYACEVFGDMGWETSAVQALAMRLLSLVELYRLRFAHVDSVIDYSSLIANPSFESGTKEGWQAGSGTRIVSSANLTMFGVGMEGDYLLYSDSSEGSGDISQTIHDLPVGYYRLTAMVGAGEEDDVTLFAGDSTLSVQQHPWGRYYLTEYVVDSVYVETDSLSIGIRGGNSWYKADKFNLYYLGRGEDYVENDIERPSAVSPSPACRAGIYDILGRRIGDPEEMVPGTIYIIDGRKIVYRNKSQKLIEEAL